MAFPRFSLKNALWVIAAIALWLATLKMKTIGSDIRVLYAVFLVAVPICGVICGSGASRRFWIGFLVVLLLQYAVESGKFPSFYRPGQSTWELSWTEAIAKIISENITMFSNKSWTKQTCWLVGYGAVSCVGGLVCRRIGHASST
jgi:hypothetical protein